MELEKTNINVQDTEHCERCFARKLEHKYKNFFEKSPDIQPNNDLNTP